MRIKTAQRYELKYLLHSDERLALAAALRDYVLPDAFGDELGQYRVTSLYFDSADYKAYWDKIEGHRFRRKVRVRVYGDQPVRSETPSFVEIKQRLNRTISKRRTTLPYKTAISPDRYDDFLDQVAVPDRAVLEEVIYLNDALQLRPACVVSYNRLAFQGSAYDPGLRITFDTNLTGRVHALSLAETTAENHFFLPPQWCIMEIKVNNRVPFWLTEIVGKFNCSFRSISKYCAVLEANHVIRQRQRIFTQPELNI